MPVNFAPDAPIWIDEPPTYHPALGALIESVDGSEEGLSPSSRWPSEDVETARGNVLSGGAKAQLLDEVADLIAEAICAELSSDFGKLRLVPHGELTEKAKAKG